MKISDFPVVDAPRVAILMGSDSDLEVMAKAHKALGEFGVPADIKVISAHRNPKDLEAYINSTTAEVFICGAGMAAHLAGVTAALTPKPVIGVPCLSPYVGGLDALLAMAQMPKGVPVATVAINGSQNAGILAAQILAVGDDDLKEKLVAFKAQMAEDGRAKNK
ncbi:MAG: 5-(carboxyamino)imidazole ribonucleotide mutase [Bdellovibrionales bacterium]|nr:5-(carboxyamino)imidazole ribonucleotide mutase [Bdellovibrionales bacterium]